MEQKILQYEGPVRNEEIVLKVASYAYGNQLFVGMMRPGEEEESYGDLTINLPYEDVERNEAFISESRVSSHIKKPAFAFSCSKVRMLWKYSGMLARRFR